MNRYAVTLAVGKHVDLYQLCEDFDLYSGPREEVFIHCPFHDERTPSARLYPDNFCWCFSCHKMYSPIDLVMHLEDISFAGAVEWLQKKYGFSLGQWQKLQLEKQNKENDKWSERVISLKGQVPFKSYLALWAHADQGRLTEKIYRDIIKESLIAR